MTAGLAPLPSFPHTPEVASGDSSDGAAQSDAAIQVDPAPLTSHDPAEGPAPHPMIGMTVGGYQIEEMIGQGGMGQVFRARQISLGSRCCHKSFK